MARVRYWITQSSSYVLIVPFVLVLLGTDYMPTGDETWQLQAAYRLAHGKGYTSSRTQLTNDLSVPTYRILTHWPIGYSALVAFLLKLGVDYQMALRLFKSIVILACLYTWKRYSRATGTNEQSVVIFGIILVPVVVYFSYSVTDLILVSMMPVLLSWSDRIMNGPKPVHDWRGVFALGMLISVLIMIKYLAVVYLIIAAGVIWRSAKGAKRDALVSIARVSILPILVVGAYFAVNGALTAKLWPLEQPASEVNLSMSVSHLTLDPIWLVDIFKVFVIDSLRFDTVASRFLVIAKLQEHEMTFLRAVSVFIGCGGVILLVRAYWTNQRGRKPIGTLGMVFGSYFSFLGALTILVNPDPLNPHIVYTRYYQPVFLLMSLTAIQCMWPRHGVQRNLYVGIVIVVTSISLGSTMVYSIKRRNLAEQQESDRTALRGRIGELMRTKQVTHVFLITAGHAMSCVDDFVPTYRTMEILSDRTRFSLPTLVVVVKPVSDDKDTKEIASAHDEFVLSKMNVEVIHGMKFYWRVFDPGLLLSQTAEEL